jgi:hypothetical protein
MPTETPVLSFPAVTETSQFPGIGMGLERQRLAPSDPRPVNGSYLNGDGQWKNCKFDKCVKSFGTVGDRPVTGNWTATGIANIRLYRPGTGEWFLDLNGNGKWDGCDIDACIQFLD